MKNIKAELEVAVRSLERRIKDIGDRMVRCQKSCEGAAIEPEAGIIPRCLIFDGEGRKGNNGSVIVGINPGSSNPDERAHCRRKVTYEDWLAFWRNKTRVYRYYKHLRSFADQFGFTGPILWTELAKCEKLTDIRRLSVQTLRVCANTYLKEEITHIPVDWPLIAVGAEVYKALSYMFPCRAIVGIPHVIGSRGQYWKMFDKNTLRHQYKQAYFDSLERTGAAGTALWLPDVDR